MANIKYFGFAKTSSSTPIWGNNLLSESNDEVQLQVGKVLNDGQRYYQKQKISICVLRRGKGQLKTQLGCWYCKKDNRDILYFSLCSHDYPERQIYAAINQLRDHLAKLGDYQSEPDSTLRLHSKDFIEGLCKDFQNLKRFDKTTVVGTAAEQITNEARRDTAKIVEKLDQKSDHLKQKALEDDKNKFFNRGCKIKVIFGIAAISLILFAILPKAIKSDK